MYHSADDTNLLNISPSIKRMNKQVNIDLKALTTWLLANKISLNNDKTELIIFRNNKKTAKDIKIKFNGKKLNPMYSN